MNTFRQLVTGFAALIAMTGITIIAPAPAQALTGFSNGSFESPVVVPNTFQRFFVGASMGGWTVTQGSVDLSGAGFWQNADGVQSLDLDGLEGHQGGVAQGFSTIPLLKYKVTYKLAGNPVFGPPIKTGQVLANGTVVQSFSFDITGKTLTNMGWVGKETHFIATSLSTTLEFRSTTGSGFGPALDDVDVQSCLIVICLG